MLIKAVTKNGQAVAFHPEELHEEMVSYALKKMNTAEKIYTLQKGSVTVGAHSVNKDSHGNWVCQIEGVAKVGYVCGKSGNNFDFKNTSFKITSKSSKDDLGQPDIEVINHSFIHNDDNPSANVGQMPKRETETPVVQVEKKKK